MHSAQQHVPPVLDKSAPNTDARRIKAIFIASSGNLVEWFDFYVYSFCAIYFAPSFFPKGNQTTELLYTAGVFAAGFLMRPIGGWLFGRIADRHGRRTSMIISVLMMCAGSLGVACLPTYAQIGVMAPVLLLVARLVQGLSVGGEYGTSATYMSEIAPPGRRGFFASFQYVTLIGGQLTAVLVLAVMQQFLSQDELRAWGWRVPFVLGALGALIALYLRRSLEETTTADSRRQAGAGTMAALMKHKRAFITVIGFTAGGSLAFYTFTTYMQKYLVNSAGIEAKTANNLMTAALFCYMIMQPLFGALSDRIGRRNSMLWFGGLACICSVPLLHLLKGASNPYMALVLVVTALAIISFYTSVGGLIKAEMFPVEVRALGVGLSYAVGNALFGGTAEFVALLLKSHGMESVFYWYVAGMCGVAFIVAYFMPDPTKSGLLVD